MNVPKNYYLKMFYLIFSKSEEYNMKIFMKSSLVFNEFEVDIYKPQNSKIINAYNFINSLHGSILKFKGNIFINNHIKVNSKAFLMRDLGFENYILNEDLKAVFDPNYILNPHLSIIKPHPLKYVKRHNKHLNYLLSKIEL
jgi:hypothetical protein